MFLELSGMRRLGKSVLFQEFGYHMLTLEIGGETGFVLCSLNELFYWRHEFTIGVDIIYASSAISMGDSGGEWQGMADEAYIISTQ